MMRRSFTLLACGVLLALAACTGDSQLPEPSGKGAVRGINAVPGSPAVTFRIEERALGALPYKTSSTPALYDNFAYNFNFDINIPGEDDPQRIASVATQLEDGLEYVFVLAGDLASPSVTTWTTPLREWSGSETVFEARFAHLAASLGDVDVYFYEESGPAPLQGEQVATLSYGEVMDIADFEQGTYVALITAAGDIGTVHHETAAAILSAQSSHLFSVFDGDANDTSPFIVWSMSSGGQSQRLPDPGYAPTVRFIHGASTLPAVDIYNDEALTSLVASNLALGQATADFDTVTEATTWYFTPVDSTATVLFSQAISATPVSTPTDMYLAGTTDAWVGVSLAPDRAPAATQAKLSLFHTAIEAGSVDLYVVERGATVAEDAIPTLGRISYRLPSGATAVAAGSYDIYLTEAFNKTVVGGPFGLDVTSGDVVFLLAYDDALNPGSVIVANASLP